MNLKAFIPILLLLSVGNILQAQIKIQSEFIGRTKYKDYKMDGEKPRGGAIISSFSATVPFYYRLSEIEKPIIWAVSLSSSYNAYRNKQIPKTKIPKEVLDMNLGVTHIRHIDEKWQMIVHLGFGIYTAHTKIDKIELNNILVNGGMIFIWQANEKIKLGIGGLTTNILGYPMVFPIPYFQWKVGLFDLDIQIGAISKVTAGFKINDRTKLNLLVSKNRAIALKKVEGKKMIYDHAYTTIGFQPEFTFGKFSVPVTIGVTASRGGRYKRRKLKKMFQSYSSNFRPAPYLGVALQYKLF